jgi:hypothetical protein
VKRLAGPLLALAGFALAALLLAQQDLGEVAALLRAGGAGLVLAALAHVPVHGAERAGVAAAAAAPRAPFPPGDDGDRLGAGVGERAAAGGAPGRRGGELPPAARGGRDRRRRPWRA